MKTFEEASLEAVARVSQLKAEASDVAFVFFTAEVIDLIGKPAFIKMLPRWEKRFAQAQKEYARGAV